MTEAVEYMVQRFLSWKLPENFNPDAGISFKPTFNDHLPVPMKHNPTGTNLFDCTQAKAMVEHMLEGLPTAEALAAKDAKIAEWRRDEVQAIGAAISTRNWQALERSYNSLRDKMDRHAIAALKEKNDDA